jgi:hypothetical protein
MNKFDYRYRAHALQKVIEEELSPDAMEDFIRVLNGEGGVRLVRLSPDALRGLVAFWLYYRFRAGITEQSVFREVLDAAWNHNHPMVRRAVNDRRVLRSMFRDAGFPSPTGMPANTEIWRGTSGISLRKARRGISWTTKRGVACWFATCFWAARHNKPLPLVIRATVATADLIFPSNERNEFETIYFEGHAAEIDGNEEDWRSAGRRWSDQERAFDAAMSSG